MLGSNHPAILESMQELAIPYKEQARYVEAEPLLLRALEGRRIKLSDTHPYTTESLKNLIDLYDTWKKLKSGGQSCLKQKLWTSDITDAKPPLSGAQKHTDFQVT